MNLKKFFVVVLFIFGLNLNLFAGIISAQEKLSKTAQYLCEHVNNSLCDINESYVNLNEYHKVLLPQLNDNTLNMMEETLPLDIKNALDSIQSVTSIYDIRNILLSEIKFSKYYDLSVLFIDNTLAPLETSIAGDSIWEEKVLMYESSVVNYNNLYTDPYRDSVLSWTELGRNFIDSARQLRSSANAGISISKATFLYPYVKGIETIEKNINVFNNIEAGYKVIADLVPLLVEIIPKISKGTFTDYDSQNLIDKSNDIISTMDTKYGNSKPSKVINTLLLINRIISLSEQNKSLSVLYSKYKDDKFVSNTLEVTRDLINSKTMIAAADTIKVITAFIPSGAGIVDNIVDVSNNLIKAFGDYELKLRRILHKNSLADNYLRLYTQRMSLNTSLYVHFMFNYFNKHASKIVTLEQFSLSSIIDDTLIPEEDKPKLIITIPESVTISNYEISGNIGDTISLQAGITASYLKECILEANENNVPLKLWYYDLTQNTNQPNRDSLILDIDMSDLSVNFEMPLSKIQPLSFTYDINNDINKRHSCGLPEKWESFLVDTEKEGGGTPVVTLNSVKKTGQTKSYIDFDDGYYQVGVNQSYTRDDSTNIVTDNITKLQWQDDDEAKTITKTWIDAKIYCEELDLGGFDDWRLPHIKELESILDIQYINDSYIHSIFKNTLYYYWSNTQFTDDITRAWTVAFMYASIYDNPYSAKSSVRCVRAGE